MTRRLSIPRIARTLHAWAGATLSLLVILVAVTGALLVWKDDYLRLTIPAARAPFEPSAQALARIAEGAEAAFGADRIAIVYFATERLALSEVTLIDESMAYLDAEGRVIDAWTVGGRPEDWLFDLHHRLLLGRTGLFVVGFAGLSVAVLVIAGFIAWWPMRRAIRLGVLLRGTQRTDLQLSHRNIGAIAAIPILIAVLCGAALAFPDSSRAALMFRVRNDLTYGEDFVEKMDGLSGAEVAGWEPALERALAVFPGATVRAASWPAVNPPYRVIRLQQPGAWSRLGDSIVYIDAFEGYMDIRIDARTLPWEERLFNALYPVHTAGLGAVVYRLYVFLTGAAFAALGALGLWAFLLRLRPSKSSAGAD